MLEIIKSFSTSKDGFEGKIVTSERTIEFFYETQNYCCEVATCGLKRNDGVDIVGAELCDFTLEEVAEPVIPFDSCDISTFSDTYTYNLKLVTSKGLFVYFFSNKHNREYPRNLDIKINGELYMNVAI